MAQKVQNNTPRSAEAALGLEVSWQVTSTRQDAWLNSAHDEELRSDPRARSLHPSLALGSGRTEASNGPRRAQIMKRTKAMREQQAKLRAAETATMN
jgi:hypothetical protein